MRNKILGAIGIGLVVGGIGGVVGGLAGFPSWAVGAAIGAIVPSIWFVVFGRQKS